MVAAASLDEQYMRRALFHAGRGSGRTTPNPMVGAVVVAPDGVVMGQGFHERAGEAHAEVYALKAAGERARGATLYVTLEPCCHVGRTPPCTRAIIAAGITRVVAAMPDPDPRVSGRGIDELRAHGIRVDVGVSAAEAERLNAAFITSRIHGRPLIVLKAATSLDARVASAPGVRTAISSHQAQQRSQRLRATIDAIAVGSGTMLADDPLLTARGCYRERSLLRVIFDRRLRTPPSSRIFSTRNQGPVLVVTTSRDSDAARRLIEAGADLLEAPTLDAAVRGLHDRGVSTLLVEGGPELQRAFAQAGLVDRLHLVVAPHTLGAGGIQWLDVQTLSIPPGGVVSAEPCGPDTWIEADVHWHR